MAVSRGTHLNEQGTSGQILVEPLGPEAHGSGDPRSLPLQLGLELQPKTDRPVYCSECFSKMHNNG